LFAEKLDLLLKLNESEKVTWSGKHRPSINNLGVYPRPFQKKLPIWVAIGGTPKSIERAAKLNLPMALAIIGGSPDGFAPHVQYFRDTAKKAGHDLTKLKVGINSHAYISDTSQKASDEFYPSYAYVMTRIGRERGWPPMDREHYELMRSPEGSLLVGSPQQVIDKILYEHQLFKHDRFLAQMSVGTLPHDKVMRSIELFGTQVAPVIRKEIPS
jgi:alkanesulfonate monooxygenase SsuD/methylene tetrahydromethanopterin reductase-like flavin-dependent oxidoreductase (luciferase family)